MKISLNKKVFSEEEMSYNYPRKTEEKLEDWENMVDLERYHVMSEDVILNIYIGRTLQEI